MAPKIKINLPLISAIVVLVAVYAVVVFGNHDSNDGCSAEYRTDKVVRIGKHRIKAEEAKTAAQRELGLGGRACIGSNHAMLFSFAKPGQYAVWMKGMKFPIDIAWIDTSHKVVGLEKNVVPSTYPDRFVNKNKPAQYILELQANRTETLGLTIGTIVEF